MGVIKTMSQYFENLVSKQPADFYNLEIISNYIKHESRFITSEAYKTFIEKVMMMRLKD